jgi:2'-5' RNA ligase
VDSPPRPPTGGREGHAAQGPEGTVGEVPQFAIIAPIDALAVGDRHAVGRFPLHVTIVSPFTVLAGRRAVVEAVAGVAAGTQPIPTAIGATARFGPNRDVPVALVEPDLLTDLHTSLLVALEPLGWSAVDGDVDGAGYRPHVTATRQAALAVGAVLIFDHLVVVDIDRDDATIVSVAALAGAPA